MVIRHFLDAITRVSETLVTIKSRAENIPMLYVDAYLVPQLVETDTVKLD